MQNKLTLTCAALVVAIPSFAIAQTSGAGGTGMGNAPSTSVPSPSQDKTPAVGSATGRSSNSYPPSDPKKPDVDGMHPSGTEKNNFPK